MISPTRRAKSVDQWKWRANDIVLTRRANGAAVATSVELYITAAYWFTASTSFANSAVTIARGFSNTFARIRPADVAPFIVAQLLGAVAAMPVCHGLLSSQPTEDR
jgi:glycerol uptake facilitator-like aquaporin